jgi:hypothetical protein
MVVGSNPCRNEKMLGSDCLGLVPPQILKEPATKGMVQRINYALAFTVQKVLEKGNQQIFFTVAAAVYLGELNLIDDPVRRKAFKKSKPSSLSIQLRRLRA